MKSILKKDVHPLCENFGSVHNYLLDQTILQPSITKYAPDQMYFRSTPLEQISFEKNVLTLFDQITFDRMSFDQMIGVQAERTRQYFGVLKIR